ncbi:ABC transporter ATP-binding protein [Agaribacter marinus]|uniref:ABC transporter ATP-binding protein n=1 Tax=Agaribacter marinus TaxID=1431249 RepID=A0AA37SSK9_9ALTE|nr:ABC transporter ATP-binding protein [Agaribacter marinus]GLR69171.1 ABC transporter ATP-binding protein [Agaribacter marinus]
MIRLQNINKIYRTSDIETKALNDINIHIAKGEFISIMGPSGCGKSTLLNTLGMLDSPSSGEYFFDDIPIHGLSERQLAQQRKGKVGFIFQSFNLIDELSVADNVELPLLYQKIGVKERKMRVTEVLEQLNIGHRASHMPQQLSGGQQQRVAIARALSTSPDVIMADEPTGNLDSKNGDEVMTMLSELNKIGTTIMMVTHSPYHAEYADRIIQLFDGQVVSQNKAKVDVSHA